MLPKQLHQGQQQQQQKQQGQHQGERQVQPELRFLQQPGNRFARKI